jgi:glutathione synthase/RimK-type ligase-like ATP-grasp enzyme
MPGKRVGIVGPHNDADVQELKAKVEDRGGEARVVDLEFIPSLAKASIGIDDVEFDGMKLLDFDAFYMRKVASMWFVPTRQFTREEWAGSYDVFNDYMANQRAVLSFKLSLARILCDRKLVVNPYDAWGYHHLKLHMYWILKREGFKVPAFVAGNNYFDLEAFLAEREAVAKPAVTGPVQKLDSGALEAARADLRKQPIVCQEFIEGKSIRAFVLGDDIVVACELPHKVEGVDASEHIEVMKRIDLPKEIEREIVRAARTFHMIFSGVDLQLDERTGDYYFLECNSAPYFRPYDAQVGADIGGKLADYLLERS